MDAPGGPFEIPAAREWKHAGLLCAVRQVGTPANSSFEGCVLLPDDHPWRRLPAEDIPTVSDGARVTFTDQAGWVGFDDTRHAWDLHKPASTLATQTELRERSGWTLDEAVTRTEALAEHVAAAG